MNALELAGVHQRYGRHAVLDGVDLRVAEGSFTAVLGASGSGKTTLLRVIAGFERIESGVVRLGATVFDDGRKALPPERRQIGYVPQDGALFPHLRVAANVGFGLRRRAGRREVRDLLEAVGLAGFERRYPHELSGGQQQRVALARSPAPTAGHGLSRPRAPRAARRRARRRPGRPPGRGCRLPPARR